MDPELLRTKLYLPARRAGLVARPALRRRLEDGLAQGRPLTLVSAPAGYGKTTLVAAWLQPAPGADRPGRVGWLSLDEADNQPARFFTYLAATLAAAGVSWGAARQADMVAPLPPAEHLITTLLNDVGQVELDNHLVVVLDDFHRIESPFIHEAIRLWLDRAPPRLHLVLLTRADPPLALARRRVRHEMTEIRAADLRFTAAEAATFLNDTMALGLAETEVAALAQRTEGWIAGLQLAALALQTPPGAPERADAADFVAAFSGSHHYVIDYLVEEVLRQQETPVRRFLRQTAVLSRFCAPLCDAVTGGQDSQTIIDYLERSNLFLLPLDSQRRWYRYHQLLADSLLAELDPAQQAAGHRRAADWFAARGLYAEAIEHAVAGHDPAQLVRLVRQAAGPAFQKGDMVQLAAWLQLLPPEQLVTDPEFAIYRLLSLILTGRSQEAPAALATLAPTSDAWPDPRQRARLLAIRAWVADITDSEARQPLAEEAAAALGDDDPLFTAFIAVPLGHAYLSQGRLPEAIATFSEAVALPHVQGAIFVRLSLLGNLVHTLNIAGRRGEAWAVCQQALAQFLDAHGRPLPPAGIPYLLRAWLAYDAHQLEEARADLDQGRELLQLAFQDTLLTPLEVELTAWLYEDEAQTAAARQALAAGRERAVRQQYQQAVLALDRVAADLNLRHDRPAAVRRWIKSLPLFSGRADGGRWQAVSPAYDAAYLTYARLLLAEERLAEARSLLPLLVTSLRQAGRGRSLISALLLAGVVAGDPRPLLQEAVQRAEAEQYLRLCLDEAAYPAHGPRLAALLRPAAAAAAAPAFGDALLADLPPPEQAAAARLPAAPTGAAPVEPLTDQEQVVLGLLVAGLSNREIAAELVITVGTAKWHVHNIYQKLEVGSRAQAVARALEWGLVDPGQT